MKNKKAVFGVLVFLAAANIFAFLAIFQSRGNRTLDVNFLDVGQGDAIFIVTPQKRQILIDGGPDSKILEKLGTLMPFWDRSIDLIILSHPESDHLTGLLDVLSKYRVENVVWTGAGKDSPDFKEWKNLLEKEKAGVFTVHAGQKITLSDGVKFRILHPSNDVGGREFKDSNDTSLVLEMLFGEKTFLFTGDVSLSGEEKILQFFPDIKTDVLKISHHGSRDATGEDFISAIVPELAVISVEGKKGVEGDSCDNKTRNRYGHPNCSVLEILDKYGIKVLRTDYLGDIKVVTNGKNLEIK